MHHSNLGISFHEDRAAQACAVLMGSRVGARENYTKLLKLLYMADRDTLAETGLSITGCQVVNMKNGPVLSEVYSCIKGEPAGSRWDAVLERSGYDLVLRKNPGDDELSDFEVSVLERLRETYRTYNFGAMIDVVHGLPEWRDPAPNKVQQVHLSDVLREGFAFTDDELMKIEARNVATSEPHAR